MLKYILGTIFLVTILLGLSITALIMGTGKFWKCPGQTSLYTWLLGFGAIGILFSWLCIVIVCSIFYITIHRILFFILKRLSKEMFVTTMGIAVRVFCFCIQL